MAPITKQPNEQRNTMNAKKELLDHIAARKVKYVHIISRDKYSTPRKTIAGTLDEVLPRLDFDYDEGYGSQKLFGTIWYTDGTWSERGEYDGSEWWEHKVCPPIPKAANGLRKPRRTRR